MIMLPRLRKLTLTVHVIASMGWLGAVTSFLALAIVGLTSQNVQLVRATYLSMEVITSAVILPMTIASLLSGIIQSLGTKWGLFRHYWVLIKLLITILSTLILLVHMQPIGYMANIAAETVVSDTDFRPLRVQLVVDSGAALLALLVATTLSVYKPQGLTPYGWRKQSQPPLGSSPTEVTTWG